MTVLTPFDEGDMFSGVLDDSGPPPLSTAEDSNSGTPSLAQVISQPSYHETHYGTGDEDDLMSLDGAISSSRDGRANDGSGASDNKRFTSLDDDDDDSPTPKNQPKRSSGSGPVLSKKSSLASKNRTPSSTKKAAAVTSTATMKKSPPMHDPSLPTVELSRRSDLYKVPVPISQKVLDSVDCLHPVDWSDAFCLQFHQMLDRLPNSWFELCKKFDMVSTTDHLFRFLMCDLGASTPMAFLGIDHRNKVRLVHNLVVAPNTGNLLNPTPIFLGLTHSSFDGAPIMLDPDDVDGLLLNVEYSDVPSAAEIFKACCFDDASPGGASKSTPRSIGTPPKFRFESMRFGSLKTSSSSYDETDASFGCKGLFPIHPAISGLLLHHFKSVGVGSNRGSAPALASMVFEFIHDRWSVSTSVETRMKCTSFPMNHDLVRPFHDLFRFLWFAHHRASKLESLSFEVPADHDEAKKVFTSYCVKIFPELTPQAPSGQSHSVTFLPREVIGEFF